MRFCVHVRPLAVRTPSLLRIDAMPSSGARRARSRISCSFFKVGLPPMLPGAPSQDFQLRMVATFPVQLESHSIRVHGDYYLFKHGTQNPFARRSRCIWVVPETWEIRPQCQDLCALSLSCCWRLAFAFCPDLAFKARHFYKPLVPATFQIPSNKSILGVNGVVLPLHARGLVPRLLQSQLQLI